MFHSLRTRILVGMGVLLTWACICPFSLWSVVPSPTPASRPPSVRPTFSPPATTIPLPPDTPDMVNLQDRLVQLYRQSNPGVVTIRLLDGSGLGSGFVVDEAGYIVTNVHVVEDNQEVEVDFPAGWMTRAEVIGTDPDLDIAVLQVDAPQDVLRPLPLGDSDALPVGSVVVAIGNPFGLNGTMTLGIVSAKGRTMASEHMLAGGGVFFTGDIIQTDAPINPGNSGGPLLNLDGEVVGVNRAIQTETFSASGEPLNSGIGFAVPINLVKRALPTLIEVGTYDHPYLGISTLDGLSLPVLEELGLPPRGGVYVVDVVPNSPAARAGLRAANQPASTPGMYRGGDYIISVDGREVYAFGDLMSYLLNHTRPGDTITLRVWRHGQEVELEVTLGKRP